MELITLNTKNTTYQIGADTNGFLLHLYYGPRAQGDMSQLLTYYFRGNNGVPYDHKGDGTYSADSLPQEFSCYGSGDYRNHALRLADSNGVCGADFRYKSHTVKEGKYSIPGLPSSYSEGGAKTAEIVLEDSRLQCELILRYGIFYDEDIITRSAELRNTGSKSIYINKMLSMSMDFLTGEFDLIHFWGRHFNEMNTEITPVGHELISIGSRRGVTGHQHSSFAILAEKGCTEDAGACYGASVVYSGNFVIEAEQDQYCQTRFQAGLADEMLSYKVAAGKSFFAPEVILAYSGEGLTHLSHLYHRFIRENICRGKYKKIRRPILVNNWEATYFDFTGEKLVEIAKEAAGLGIEMFVLDDGWFGNRGPDDRGLGDWTVNEEKMGGTLDSVVNRIKAEGLGFGIWFEPEMVNENSLLYKEHPDWAFVIPGKPPVLGRTQLVLDFSRKEVRDAVFEQMTAVIDSTDVDYLKIDMNRSICEAYSCGADYQNFGALCYDYMLGVYEFFERLTERYPDILIEGCSSGGARFDAGLMCFTPQIWTSDNSDAIERLNIQYGASFGFPVSVVGSHVSAVPNHQNGRITEMKTRAVVAMAGNFGYELDVTKLCAEDKNQIRGQIEDFKKNWDIIHNGKYCRGAEPHTGCDFVSWSFVSQDASESLLCAVTVNCRANSPVMYAKCRGLDKSAVYRCEEDGKEYSAAALMTVGYPLPVIPGEYHAFTYHFRRI